MAHSTRRLMMGAAGAGGKTYLDDIFSTYVYEGNDTARSINNGIDLAGEGGMVWIKRRDAAFTHVINDTVRGAGKWLRSNTNNGQTVDSNRLTAFNNNGFALAGGDGDVNSSAGSKYSSWSFRKAPGFFDVVTYTGTGSARTVSHDLGSLPGCIMVKRTDTSDDWVVYHRGLHNIYGGTAGQYYLYLNDSSPYMGGASRFNDTAPTATEFTVGTDGGTNASGGEYVAYIFAHDEQSFGEGGDQSIISCGTYTGNGNTDGPTITLGWDPQFVIIKRVNGSEGWVMFDTMRGLHAGGNDKALFPNQDTVEQNRSAGNIWPLDVGFRMHGSTDAKVNGNNDKYIFIAVRALCGAVSTTPTLGTEVFAMDTGAGSSTIPNYDSGFPVDFALARATASDSNWRTGARLMGEEYLVTNTTAAEVDNTDFAWDSNVGWSKDNFAATFQSWMWKRGAGFDVVAYSGNQTSGRQIRHNLSKTPEMIWVKARSGVTGSWVVGHKGLNGGTDPWDYSLVLNTDGVEADNVNKWNDQAPNSTHFTLGNSSWVNHSSDCSYIAMLFASVEGISKCGFYAGSGSPVTLDLGFSPRFIVTKNRSGGNSWSVYDTLRGISAGNDQQLHLQANWAQGNTRDALDLTSNGVTFNSVHADTNIAGGNYIYYAHA